MKRIFPFCAAFLFSCAGLAAFEIKESKNAVAMNNGELSARLLANRNYGFNLTGRDKDGKNFGLVIQTMIWYHGRTGNTRRFYQDQSELGTWKPRKREVENGTVRVFTGDVNYNVIRETQMYPDTSAVSLKYIIESAESRGISGSVNFPGIYLTKEIESVSFDDGTLKNFRTSALPENSDLIHTRALLLHIPKRGKTLLVLIDPNAPLAYGQKLGIAVKHQKLNWCRTLNFIHLWQDSLSYLEKGRKFGVCVYFRLLDGGELNEAQKAEARKLAERFQLKRARFSRADLAEEYEKPSALAGKFAGVPGISLWGESPMKRVYPHTLVPGKTLDAIRLESAANEWESFQLVLKPEREGILEKIEFSDLRASDGRSIPAAQCRGWLLEYQRIAAPRALFYGETRFADKLLPLADVLPHKLTPGENTIAHLSVRAPEGTPRGTYRGKVTLRFSGGRTAELPLVLKVWGFELPKRSAYCGHGLLWDTPQEHREEVLKYLTECGMNGTVYHGGQSELRKYFDGKELRLPDNFALAEKALREYGMPMFQTPWLFLGAWNWKPGKKVQFLHLDIETPEFEEKFSNYFKSFHRQMKEKGILEHCFTYFWDEMTGGHYEAMRKTVALVRKNAPGLRIMTVSAPDPEVLANNDIICTGPFSGWWSKEAGEIVQAARKNGKEFWVYMNGTTFQTTVEAIVPRLTPWMCFSHGFSGYLQWSMDYNWKSGTFAKNGNVWLLYPSDKKPVYSVRLEYFRDGVEDFNMMRLTEKLPPAVRAELEKEIRSIAPVSGKTSTDPLKLTLVRRKIGETLERHLR